MVVTVDHNISVAFIERLEERLYREVVAVRPAGAEERLVPIGKGAGRWMRREVRAQPFILGRTGLAAADGQTLAVQHDDVPFSEFIAIVAGFRVSCRRAEIVKVWRRPGRMKFVIARSGPGAGFDAAPGLVVANEILFGAVGIREIA